MAVRSSNIVAARGTKRRLNSEIVRMLINSQLSPMPSELLSALVVWIR